MSEFRDRLDQARRGVSEDCLGRTFHDQCDYLRKRYFLAGASAVLEIIAEEHERYLSTNEPRSTIGPMFDAGLNTAAGEMLKSCRERLEELSR